MGSPRTRKLASPTACGSAAGAFEFAAAGARRAASHRLSLTLKAPRVDPSPSRFAAPAATRQPHVEVERARLRRSGEVGGLCRRGATLRQVRSTRHAVSPLWRLLNFEKHPCGKC